MKANITLFTVFLSKSYSYVWFGIVMKWFLQKNVLDLVLQNSDLEARRLLYILLYVLPFLLIRP
jgi:hypothetical protein